MQFKAARQFLPATRRIRDRQAFGRAIDSNRQSNKWFVAYSCKNGEGHSRLGMIVSKRVMSKAVARNYAKRMIREAFRQNIPAESPLDIVIQPRRPISLACATEGREALKDLLSALRT